MKLSKKGKIKLIVCICLVALVVIGFTLGTNEDVVSAIDNASTPVYNDCIVEIKGEVNREGIYSIKESARVNDLIILANGLTSEADVSSVNLAEKVSDGMVIIIPKLVVKENDEVMGKVSINDATKEELMTLTGIGEAKSLAIISYRINNNGFKRLEDLMNVSGISERIFNNIKDKITI